MSSVSSKHMTRRVATKLIETVTLRGIGLGVTALAAVLIVRALGPRDTGVYSTLAAGVNRASTIGYLSLGQVALSLAVNQNLKEWLPVLTGTLATFCGAVSVLGWLLIGGWFLWSRSVTFAGANLLVVLLCFSGLPFLIWDQLGSCLLIIIGEVSAYVRLQAGVRTIFLVGVVAGLRTHKLSLLSAVVLTLGSQILIAVAGMSKVLRGAPLRALHFSRTLMQRLLGAGARLHWNAIGALLVTSAQTLIVNHYCGARETGYFQLAVRISSVPLVIPQALSMVLYEQVVRTGPAAAWRLNINVCAATIASFAVLSVVIARTAMHVVTLVGGQRFGPSAPVLRLMIFALIGQGASLLFGVQWISRGLLGLTAAITVSLGALSIALSMAMTPRWGAVGAATSIVVTSCAGLVVNLVLAARVRRGDRLPARVALHPAVELT